MAVGETGMYMNFPYSKEPVTVWVHHTLSGTKSNSAVGLDEVVYRLIKAVRDTRLGQEVLCEVVAVLIGWNILDRWRNIRVVLILKLGRNLTQTTTWRPLNLSNCMGKSKSTVCYHTPTLIIVSYFLISHVYYICYSLLSTHGHQGNAGTLSQVMFCQLPKTVISFYIQSCSRNQYCRRQTAFISML